MADASYLVTFARYLLGTVWLVAGVTKLGQLRSFEHTVAQYRLLPESWTRLVALLLSLSEALVGVCLLGGILIPAMAAYGSFLLFIFSGAMAINLWRRRSIECGCFGPTSSRISWKSITRTVFLALLALGIAIQVTAGSLADDRGAAAVPAVLSVFMLLMLRELVAYLRTVSRLQELGLWKR